MKKLLPLLALLLVNNSVLSQSWNPLKPTTRNYFTNSNGYLRAIEIDSVIGYGGDLHYYPYRRLKISEGGIGGFTPDTIGSWIGRYVVARPNGDYQFVNHWNDTVLIRARAEVGDSWTFVQHGNKHYTAEVVSADTMTIFGSLDSVKRIELHAFEGTTWSAADSFEGMELVLSKANGFKKTTELYYFPFHKPDTTEVVRDYYFTRSLYPMDDFMSISQIPGKHTCTYEPVQIPASTPAQFFDWNVGDIYQYDACFTYWVMASNLCQPPYSHRLDTIIAKNITTNGVEYIRRGWKAMPVYGFTNIPLYYTFSTHQDTVFFANTGNFYEDGNDSSSIGVPEKINHDHGLILGWHHYYFPLDTTHCMVGPAHYKRGFAFWGLHNQTAFYGHKQGLGHITSDLMSYDNIFIYGHNNLIYSVRNGVPCGNYVLPDTVVPVSVRLLSEENNILVYPNPTSEQVTVLSALPGNNLYLTNSIGQGVFVTKNCSTKEAINTRNLPGGVYMLKIETAAGEVSNRKIIVQH